MGHRVNYLQNNWLIMKIGNKLIKKHKSYFRGTVCDLGCGERPYEQEILSVADNYIEIDWSDTQHKLKADIIADFNKVLPIDNEVADAVTSFQWWVHEAPYDYYRYTPYGLKHLFAKSGFQSVNVIAYAGLFTVWILKLNYFSTRFIRGTKIIRGLIKSILILFWNIGQLLAQLLDKLDRS